MEADIRGCFDNISHEWLLKHAPMDRVVLRKWLKAGYMEKNVFYHANAGTPQGGVISPTLANFVLNGLEALLRKLFPSRTPRPKVHLVRYCDDFIITGISKELLENQVMPVVADFLRERGLVFSPEKTFITHISDGFDFLGQNLRRYKGGKTLTKPSKRNILTFLRNIQELINQHRQSEQATLIRLLNQLSGDGQTITGMSVAKEHSHMWIIEYSKWCGGGVFEDILINQKDGLKRNTLEAWEVETGCFKLPT